MARVSLYRGASSFQEELVGTLDGEVVELGRYSNATYPGRLVNGSSVTTGQYSSTTEVGKVDADQHTILRRTTSGWGDGYEPVGEVDANGDVFLGTGMRRQRAGRVDPPNAGAAACLVLLVLIDQPRNAGSRSSWGDVAPPDAASAPDVDQAAKLVGEVAGVAGGLLAASIASRAGRRKKQPRTTADDPPPSASVDPTAGWFPENLSDADVEGLIARVVSLGWPLEGEGGIRWALDTGRVTKAKLPMFLWVQLCLRIGIEGGFRDAQTVPQPPPPPPPGWVSGGWRALPAAKLADTRAVETGHQSASSSAAAVPPRPARDLPPGVPEAAQEVVTVGTTLVVPDLLDVEIVRVFNATEAKGNDRLYHAHGTLIVIGLQMTNQSKNPARVNGRLLALMDTAGCVYDTVAGEGTEQFYWLRNPLLSREIQPGGTEVGLVGFDVPTDRVPAIKYLRVMRDWNDFAIDPTYAYVELPDATPVEHHEGSDG